MRNDLEILVAGLKQAAINAGDHIGHRVAEHNIYCEKPLKQLDDSSNPVTALDKEGERIVVQTLNALPFAKRLQIHGEEHQYKQQGDIRIDIDPIDGTKSWVRGEFLSTVSIGAHIGDKHVGVVYDFMRGILYATDVKKDKTHQLIARATYRNHDGIERLLPVNDKIILNNLKVLSDDPTQYRKLFGKNPSYEVIGSIALGLAQVAYGAIDGIVIKSQKTCYYDISGGLALAKASGVNVTDYDGKAVTPTSFNNGIIALRPHVKVEKDPQMALGLEYK